VCRKHEGDEKLNILIKNPLEGSHLEDISEDEDGIIVLYWILRKREEGVRGIQLAIGAHAYKGGACCVVSCDNF
jgi:hypothetical protein